MSLLARHKAVTWATEGLTADTAVLADPTLMERVLVNLLGNAIEFSPKNGTIIVETVPNGQMLVFRICDEGPGIPMEWEKQVFRKFEQLRARRAGAATGTGLGLAFCKLAVEAQNGRIWLEKPPDDRGTVICFSLPLSAQNHAEPLPSQIHKT